MTDSWTRVAASSRSRTRARVLLAASLQPHSSASCFVLVVCCSRSRARARKLLGAGFPALCCSCCRDSQFSCKLLLLCGLKICDSLAWSLPLAASVIVGSAFARRHHNAPACKGKRKVRNERRATTRSSADASLGHPLRATAAHLLTCCAALLDAGVETSSLWQRPKQTAGRRS